jgi:OOP family OmpA-OmpF porin
MTPKPGPTAEDDVTEPEPQRSALTWAQKAGPGPLALVAFALAAGLALVIGLGAVGFLEGRARQSVEQALLLQGLDWADVAADGLLVTLTGTAPDETARARALTVAGGVVDAGRLRDQMAVTPSTPIAPPKFSVEILRNEDGIQLIGLVPDAGEKDGLAAAAQALMPSGTPANMLEVAAYPVPDGWAEALDYAGRALALLPRSKISVSADGTQITAISGSAEEKTALEGQLADMAPKGMPLVLHISAPRPVLTPFTLRFVKDDKGARFDACSADTDSAGAKILAAGEAVGAAAGASCTVGMGVPSPRWAEAALAAIQAVDRLKIATVTFSDADVTLLAGPGVAQGDFDTVVGDLKNALPDVFSLDAKLVQAADAAAAGPAEFTADLSDKGEIALRGPVTDALTQNAVQAFAEARFGLGQVYLATRLDSGLPDGWPNRVLTGLAALAELHDGKLLVRADTVAVSGSTGSMAARARISQILSEGLGQGQTFAVDVTYVEALDPSAALPTPEVCLSRVDAVMASQKIAFDPGSAAIAGASGAVLDAIAAALKDCNGLRMEIGGHTDAQGSESGNKALSQSRAEAVLVALQSRDVDVSAMRAVGYGESRPIADNTTDAGREANRRIEFTLIGGAPTSAQRAEAGAAVSTPAAQAADATAVSGAAAPDPLSAPVPSDLAPKTNAIQPKPRPKQ